MEDLSFGKVFDGFGERSSIRLSSLEALNGLSEPPCDVLSLIEAP